MAARRSFQKWIWIGLAGLGLVVAGALARFIFLPDSFSWRGEPPAALPSPTPAFSPPEAAPPGTEDEPELSYETIQAKQEAARQRMLEGRDAARWEQQERREAKQAERQKRKEARRAKHEERRRRREAFLAEHPDPDRPTQPPFEEAPRGPAVYYEEGEEPPKGVPPAPYEKRPPAQGSQEGKAAGP